MKYCILIAASYGLKITNVDYDMLEKSQILELIRNLHHLAAILNDECLV